MITALPWLLSVWTLLTMWLAGNGTKWAWISGLALQVPWLIFAVAVEAYGLLPLTVGLTVVYARNLRKALRKSKSQWRDFAAESAYFRAGNRFAQTYSPGNVTPRPGVILNPFHAAVDPSTKGDHMAVLTFDQAEIEWRMAERMAKQK